MTADTVILNGRLMTFDAARPRAGALAIRRGTILALGEEADIRPLIGPATKVIDAEGGTVTPGLIDSHVHLFMGAAELSYLSLAGICGAAALAQAVRPYAAAHPEDRVLMAVQAAYALLGPDQTTTRQALDQVLPDRALALFSADHHTVWANTRALEMAGLLHGAPVEQGAEVVMAPDGTATGELREPGAYAPVLRLCRFGGRDLLGMTTGQDPEPPATEAERAIDRAVLRQGLAHCARHGLSGLHNMDGNLYTLELLADLEAAGELLCRTEVPLHFRTGQSLSRLEEAQEMRRRFASDRLWSRRIKMFMDGVIESSTALMLAPYPGLETCGDAVFDPEEFTRVCVAGDALGFQLSVHAIGDLAVRRTLDGFAAARAANGARDSRHRIEHIETIHPDDIPRLGDLGVVASLQPGHAPRGGIAPPQGLDHRLHPHQLATAFAWRDLRAAAPRTLFATDWPVIGVAPLETLRAAVAPVALSPAWPEQRQSLHESLKSYTCDNAWAEFNEGRKGQLIAGQMADITIFSQDLEAMDPARLAEASARMTLCGGEITHAA
ncbi:amidohydrolase [Pseudooceanicola sp. CBS1P-1]|uniref:Amidohydrolase family protein n=1 Tax=Pseudooceanicola albus TaxID=2692189 RepID=A0A6L7G050_9RHOB|nr:MULTISPECIES: amidohydrolase [Pseudooceanicola]MBT9383590.1 amidohydrolase [Pseudooceanicola endophyticus]MXN17445.1 amidohydrolase family protein [Pseudooceanicola albus]